MHHSKLARPSRRELLGGAAALGAGVLASGQRAVAQLPAPGQRIINTHHHLVAPAYVKFLQENKFANFR